MNCLNYLLLFIAYIIINGNISSVNTFNLTIIHNNDLHSHFRSVDVWTSPCDENTAKLGKCFGGVARIAAKVKEIREKHRNNSLFLNAGDNFEGTLFYTLFKWKVVAEFTKLLKYDAMTIGNHDIGAGVEDFPPFVDAIKQSIPTVCCNIDVSNEPKLKDKIKKSIVFEVDGHKIAVIGYITPDTSFISSRGKTIKFMDEIDCIKEEIKHLKSQGINVFIGLGHSGFLKDKEIAEKVPEMDVIVGGHSHTLLYPNPHSKPPSIEPVVDDYPTIIRHGSHQTLIVQAYAYSKYLGLIDIEFDESGNVRRFDGKPILLDNTMTEDPDVTKVVKEYEKKIQTEYPIYEKVIGKSNVLLDGDPNCSVRECNFGNLVTDAMVEYAMRRRPRTGTGWTDAAVAVTNSGSFRTTLDAIYRDGNITMENVMTALIFNNSMIILSMTGNTVKDMLEYNVGGKDPNLKLQNGKFLQMSGLRVEYNLSRTDFHKVNKVLIRCADCRVPEYQPLNATEIYKVIVPNYIANGGDGYKILMSKDIKRLNTDYLDYKILSEYISKRPVIYPGTDNRISFVF